MSNLFNWIKPDSKNSKPPPLPTRTANLSKHVLKSVNEYIDNEDIQHTVTKAYMKMRPKPFSEVYYSKYIMDCVFSYIWHFVSLASCSPTALYVYSTYLIKDNYPVAVIASVLTILIFETVQHFALKQNFEIYHQSKKTDKVYTAIAVIFSLISIVTSTYTMVLYNMPIHILTFCIGVIILVEVLIVNTVRNIVGYLQKCMLEVVFRNDLKYGVDTANLGFTDIGANSNLPDNLNEQKQEQKQLHSNEPNRATSAKYKAGFTSGGMTLNNSNEQAVIEIKTAKKKIEAKQLNAEKNPTKKDVGNIDKSRLQWYQRTYQKKVKTAKRSDSLKRRTNRLNYINYKLSTFKQNQQDGKVYFDINNADKFAQGKQVQ